MQTEYGLSIINRDKLNRFLVEAEQDRLASEATGKLMQTAFEKTSQLMCAFARKLKSAAKPVERRAGVLPDTPSNIHGRL